MKIYRTIVIDIASGKTVSEQAFYYVGAIARAGGMFGGAPKPKPPPPPKIDEKEIQDKEAEARRRAVLARGRASTILTGDSLGSVGGK